MGACDPGHVIDIWGYYCEDLCPKCAEEKAAGENVCNICKLPQGSGQRHQAGDDFYCLPHAKVPKE